MIYVVRTSYAGKQDQKCWCMTRLKNSPEEASASKWIAMLMHMQIAIFKFLFWIRNSSNGQLQKGRKRRVMTRNGRRSKDSGLQSPKRTKESLAGRRPFARSHGARARMAPDLESRSGSPEPRRTMHGGFQKALVRLSKEPTNQSKYTEDCL